MSLFDAKTLDSDLDGAALLAAVLHPTPREKAEARERGRQRMARAGSFEEAFARGPATETERAKRPARVA